MKDNRKNIKQRKTPPISPTQESCEKFAITDQSLNIQEKVLWPTQPSAPAMKNSKNLNQMENSHTGRPSLPVPVEPSSSLLQVYK
jgi:hypothetical protein